jgi:hypothetical protein
MYMSSGVLAVQNLVDTFILNQTYTAVNPQRPWKPASLKSSVSPAPHRLTGVASYAARAAVSQIGHLIGDRLPDSVPRCDSQTCSPVQRHWLQTLCLP